MHNYFAQPSFPRRAIASILSFWFIILWGFKQLSAWYSNRQIILCTYSGCKGIRSAAYSESYFRVNMLKIVVPDAETGYSFSVGGWGDRGGREKTIQSRQIKHLHMLKSHLHLLKAIRVFWRAATDLSESIFAQGKAGTAECQHATCNLEKKTWSRLPAVTQVPICRLMHTQQQRRQEKPKAKLLSNS